jgi:hypothetical protein
VANDAPAAYYKGTTSVTWTATDAAGNKTTAIQTVTVVDVEKPLVTCPTVPVQCYVASGTYTIPSLTATDNCSSQSVTYAITGSTTRNGNGNNASGRFNEGSSVITWTITDGSGNVETCTTVVSINPRLTVSVPDVYAVNPGGNANTIYNGYGPTSLTFSASVSGGAGPYSYKWTAGSSTGPTVSTTATLTVSPTVTTTYYLSVKDKFNCSPILFTKTVEVVDVRCGPKLDKVTICALEKNILTTKCVSPNAVPGNISEGAYLGVCRDGAMTMATKAQEGEERSELSASSLSVNVLPNPSTTSFQLQIRSSKESPVTIRVVNALGAVIESRKGVAGNGTIYLGSNYKPGVYYAEVAQDGKRVAQKLIKRSE